MFTAIVLPLLVLAQEDVTAGAPAPLIRPQQGGWHVEVAVVDEVRRCTIIAEDAPLHRVMAAVAEEIGGEVEGFDNVARAALVTVELRDRELRLALEYMLGSVGLRAELRPGVISVLEDTAAVDTPEILLDRSMVAYLEATGRFPYHALGAKALLSQGEIEERRGNSGAALNRYERLLDSFQTSSLMPLAMLRTATALEGLGQYGESKAWYRDLAGLETDHGYEEEAWIGMARTSNTVRDHVEALNILTAMDADIPLATAADERMRLIERAIAHNGLGEHIEALHDLDELDRVGMPAAVQIRAFALRADSFEGLEIYGDAGRSWLIHARGVSGSAKQAALENAARLALLDGDELGVLLVAEEAEALGMKAGLEPYELEARRRLGMEFTVEEGSGSPLQRLGLAEEFAQEGDLTQAALVVEGLFDARGSFAPRDLARIYRLRALAVEGQYGLEAAIELLRLQRGSLDDPQARAVLDVVAGELFEAQGLYAEAADAYGGLF